MARLSGLREQFNLVRYGTLVDAVGKTDVPRRANVFGNEDVGSFCLTNFYQAGNVAGYGDDSAVISSIATLCSFVDQGLYGLVERSLYLRLEVNEKVKYEAPVSDSMTAPSQIITQQLPPEKIEEMLQRKLEVPIHVPPRSWVQASFEWKDQASLDAFNEAVGAKVIRLILRGVGKRDAE